MPSNRSSTIFIFSDPDEGAKHGYIWDGVAPDLSAYYYTGAGGDGDQELKGPNKSIVTHVEDGRVLQLFVAEGYVPGTSTARQRYVGQFRIDPERPYRREPAPDRAGNRSRTVLVFRLVPVGETDVAGLAESGEFADDVDSGPDSVLMPLEVDSKHFYETSATVESVAQKRESALVAAFIAWSGGRTGRFQRWAIRVPGEEVRLLTDVFDTRLRILYEAKGSSGRSHVRLALGQLLDYRRHIEGAQMLAVLLPQKPTPDLLDLLEQNSVECAWQAPSGAFEGSGAWIKLVA